MINAFTLGQAFDLSRKAKEPTRPPYTQGDYVDDNNEKSEIEVVEGLMPEKMIISSEQLNVRFVKCNRLMVLMKPKLMMLKETFRRSEWSFVTSKILN
ncbi:hypothetical protein LWI29_014515 [Acer saccharum]|uniref:Uncharacterized protein n=1 Tax=Acer saccharum TaxID=4024 RepID=A0AA39SWP5_ACESA|nr:hypothetical protein LWI29_014515 [Acer saccharum]